MRRWLIAFLVLLGILIVAAFILRYSEDRARSDQRAAVRTRLLLYCVDYRFDRGLDTATCGGSLEWANAHFEKVIACDDLSPALDDPFFRCLENEGIRPLG